MLVWVCFIYLFLVFIVQEVDIGCMGHPVKKIETPGIEVVEMISINKIINFMVSLKISDLYHGLKVRTLVFLLKEICYQMVKIE